MTMMLLNVVSNFWVHIKFNNLNFIDYKYLQGNNDPWFCVTCSSSRFPFNCLNKRFSSLLITQTGQTNSFSFDNNNSSLLLNPSPKITNPVNQLNNSTCLCTMVECTPNRLKMQN